MGLLDLNCNFAMLATFFNLVFICCLKLDRWLVDKIIWKEKFILSIVITVGWSVYICLQIFLYKIVLIEFIHISMSD